MRTDELRSEFLLFFRDKKHKIVESDSLVPRDDPTLLFTCAGMNQFKKEFMGQVSGFTRAASCQKCLRTDDLDKVGKTAFHHTFFEMLGNFSFGDYFKEEAIQWAWEFVTKKLKINESKLWVSVYQEDEEAYLIWLDKIKVKKERIVKLAADKNFWPADAPKLGPNGPCGPCSEIFFDYGKEYGCKKPDCSPACDCGRFVEIWNLVFTQFNRIGAEQLEPLKNKNIDTGMGLERMASVMQNVLTNFEIDIFKPIINEIKKNIDSDKAIDSESINIVADHIRAVVFSINDSVMPANENRGYIVRKLIRKSVIALKNLGKEEEFLYKLVPLVTMVMKNPYPQMEKRTEEIAAIVLSEEKDFLKLIKNSSKVISEQFNEENTGLVAFRLYDTYGIPLEITMEWAKKNNKTIDVESFHSHLDKQKLCSKKKSSMTGDIFIDSGIDFSKTSCSFVGYDLNKDNSKVVHLFKNKSEVDLITEGETASIVLEKTPFYAESGGQASDKGRIICNDNIFEIIEVLKQNKAIVHSGKVLKGKFKKDEIVTALIDCEYRRAVTRAHTATHLFHAALRVVLGEHVKQSGSSVEDDRLRFDFTHSSALTGDEVKEIESLVNENIKQSTVLKKEELSLEQAKKAGALMFFAEKYEDRVRMVSIGGFSKELCGGTHLDNTSEVMDFKIISESSIAKGVRRIEALTADKASCYRNKSKELYNDLIIHLGSNDFNEQIKLLNTRFKNIHKRFEDKYANIVVEKNISVDKYKDISFKVLNFKQASKNVLRIAFDYLKTKLGKDFIIVLGGSLENNVNIVVGVSKELQAKNINAPLLIKQIASIIGGSGGGRPDFAQAGGDKPERLDKAMEEAIKISKRLIDENIS
ncbi:MAG: alanine--tRNA ligase [Candidatus Gygaella obscura]|nr:alanine--tRNA ligase [Candidatus Gygaella obscura]